jgi:hypothetical protein
MENHNVAMFLPGPGLLGLARTPRYGWFSLNATVLSYGKGSLTPSTECHKNIIVAWKKTD